VADTWPIRGRGVAARWPRGGLGYAEKRVLSSISWESKRGPVSESIGEPIYLDPCGGGASRRHDSSRRRQGQLKAGRERNMYLYRTCIQ
jgi:hypothetical protein